MPKSDKQFEEHIRSRSEKPPAILYKYMSVDTARSVLSTGKLRFQSPLQYNDPFDSQWEITWPLFTPEAREYERALIEQAIRDPHSWPSDADPESKTVMEQQRIRINNLPEVQRDQAITKFVREAAPSSEVPEQYTQLIHDMRRRMRVFCLCERDCSILMWSHYADQHESIVLGFDTESLEQDWCCPLESINYTNDLPKLIDPEAWNRSMVFGLQSPELKGGEREWALTKHSDWEYEKEWRFVLRAPKGTHGDYEDFKIPKNALVELVSGCRTDTEQTQELLTLARTFQSDVRHFEMSTHPHQLQLIKVRVGPASCRANRP